MKINFDESKPIFIQIKEYIEDSIINESMQAGERVPSTNEFAKFYKINPATAAKGINELVTENVLVKRRGVGMFVTDSARANLIEKRKDQFYENYVLPVNKEAKKLDITEEQLMEMMRRGYHS
ncbi:GntR family transcriptional regulator [Virgibacillus sp. W0181]|uniref:GntR family transcriptional regulator n=1 Tax=Virgibacillus sp. W0181 TaxID=3391581 RepID=UPI003F474491